MLYLSVLSTLVSAVFTHQPTSIGPSEYAVNRTDLLKVARAVVVAMVVIVIVVV